MSQYQYNKKDLAIYDSYSWVSGEWKRAGWRCSVCDRTFKSEKNVAKHLDICKELNTTKEKHMPIQRVMKNGEAYYRWGDQGKLYKERKDAEKQAQAAYASGYKEKNNSDMEKK